MMMYRSKVPYSLVHAWNNSYHPFTLFQTSMMSEQIQDPDSSDRFNWHPRCMDSTSTVVHVPVHCVHNARSLIISGMAKSPFTFSSFVILNILNIFF